MPQSRRRDAARGPTEQLNSRAHGRPAHSRAEPSPLRYRAAGTDFKLYGRYPLLFPTLAAGVVVPYALLWLLATGEGLLQTQNHGAIAQLLPLLDWFVVAPLISALHVHAVRDVAAGQEPRIGAVARRGLAALPVVSAAVIISSVGIALGLVAFIVPGILLLFRWSVVAQTAAIDRGSWIDALRRSAALTHGNYLHILALQLLLGVGTTLLWTPAHALFAHSDTTAGSFLLGTALRILVSSFAALATAVLYFELEARPMEAAGRDDVGPRSAISLLGHRVAPTGDPLDPASWSDENRPPGWYIDPFKPRHMYYWGADGTPRWGERRMKTPRKIRVEWERRNPARRRG